MNPERRILIYRLGSLGDTVVALPCFKFIRNAFPSAHITILTNRPVQAKAALLANVLGNSGLFDEVIDYPVRLRRLSQIIRLRDRIRAGKFDLLVHLTAARGLLSSVRDYLFFRWCGIPKIIGVPVKREDLRVVQTDTGLYEAESVRLARRLRSLGEINLSDPSCWDLELTAGEKNEAEQLLAAAAIQPPFIALSLGSKLLVKDWTSENWKNLLARLSSCYSALAIVALGAEEEREKTDSILAHWKGTVANLCGRTSPRVSAAILEKASLFVGHDSGPMHLASAVGTPCVAIFSACNPPGQWFPRGDKNRILLPEKLCSVCAFLGCRQINNKCILSITVDQVQEEIKRQLETVLLASTA